MHLHVDIFHIGLNIFHRKSCNVQFHVDRILWGYFCNFLCEIVWHTQNVFEMKQYCQCYLKIAYTEFMIILEIQKVFWKKSISFHNLHSLSGVNDTNMFVLLRFSRYIPVLFWVEQAIGDDAEVACTLPNPAEVDGYQYFYPNMLSGCTSKNCDNPVIMGPFSCTQSSTFFGTGLAQMNGCTAENPQVTFSGCEEVLLWNILANPSAFVIHGLAILGLFSTLAFFAQRVLRKGNYQAISKV